MDGLSCLYNIWLVDYTYCNYSHEDVDKVGAHHGILNLGLTHFGSTEYTLGVEKHLENTTQVDDITLVTSGPFY